MTLNDMRPLGSTDIKRLLTLGQDLHDRERQGAYPLGPEEQDLIVRLLADHAVLFKNWLAVPIEVRGKVLADRDERDRTGVPPWLSIPSQEKITREALRQEAERLVDLPPADPREVVDAEWHDTPAEVLAETMPADATEPSEDPTSLLTVFCATVFCSSPVPPEDIASLGTTYCRGCRERAEAAIEEVADNPAPLTAEDLGLTPAEQNENERQEKAGNRFCHSCGEWFPPVEMMPDGEDCKDCYQKAIRAESERAERERLPCNAEYLKEVVPSEILSGGRLEADAKQHKVFWSMPQGPKAAPLVVIDGERWQAPSVQPTRTRREFREKMESIGFILDPQTKRFVTREQTQFDI